MHLGAALSESFIEVELLMDAKVGGGCNKRGEGGGGWGSNAEAKMVCGVSLIVLY